MVQGKYIHFCCCICRCYDMHGIHTCNGIATAQSYRQCMLLVRVMYIKVSFSGAGCSTSRTVGASAQAACGPSSKLLSTLLSRWRP